MLLSRQFRLAAISLLSERQRRGRGGEGEGSWGRGGGGKWETFSEGGLKNRLTCQICHEWLRRDAQISYVQPLSVKWKFKTKL